MGETDRVIGKTEYDIDTWSYRFGLSEGYIPSDVSNSSTLVYPVLDNGCVDASFNYTAPKHPGKSFGLRRLDRGWISAGLGTLGSMVVTALL